MRASWLLPIGCLLALGVHAENGIVSDRIPRKFSDPAATPKAQDFVVADLKLELIW